MNIGDQVLVPAPTSNDLWHHEFAGRVDEVRTDTGYTRVVDQDNDSWDVEPYRLTTI